MEDTHALPAHPPAPAPGANRPPLTPSVRRQAAVEPGGVERPFSESLPVRAHIVEGAGGVALSVYEAGDPYGPPLLFVHGFSQSHLAWQRQLQSALGLGFRLVAVDLRGHGRSQKPRDAYGDGRLWAEDLQAVISSLRLERPLLVGWSYGGMVICDYLRHYGQAHLAGIHFVSAISQSGSEQAFRQLAPDFLQLLPGFLAQDADTSHSTLEAFVSLLYQRPVSPETLYAVLGYNSVVPPYVREGLASRLVDNDDVLRRLTLPVLVSHGLEDRVVLPGASHHLASVIPGAQVSLYAGTGHSPFWEDARRFNRELTTFAARCW